MSDNTTGAGGSSRRRILVVDDDPGIRETLGALLEDEGYAVTSALSGSNAKDIMQGDAFDLVISDVRMPNGDGTELLKGIREDNPEIPIVFMMSGFSDLSPAEAEAMGAQAFFHKPFDVEALLDEIEALLDAQ